LSNLGIIAVGTLFISGMIDASFLASATPLPELPWGRSVED
jgi:hypothetical protein